MKKVMIFAGTTEGRVLSETLASAGIAHIVSVATEYGEMTMKEHPLVEVKRGRMNATEMEAFFEEKAFLAVVDATHPYAKVVTRHVKQAAERTNIPYVRLEREKNASFQDEQIRYFSSHEECAEALASISGNILLTTGSKDLGTYTADEKLRERLFVRVLPGLESIELCMQNGICGKQIIAMQGPFSQVLNEALLQQYKISCLVTKVSGKNGGYEEKIRAANEIGIPVFVIGSANESDQDLNEPQYPTFSTVQDLCKHLEQICHISVNLKVQMSIMLCGIGMGSSDTMTNEVERAIQNADILLGAERMIRPYSAKIDKQPFYRTEQIIPYLKTIANSGASAFSEREIRVVILFSGDSGFFSGAQSLYRALSEEIELGTIDGTVHILPGISSISYLASLTGESYHDAQSLSMHGREIVNLASRIAANRKTFLLTNGASSLRELGKLLCSYGLNHCEIYVGVQLSYPEEKLLKMTPEECAEMQEQGLMTCLIINSDKTTERACHGRSDSEFIRDKVPMTKEETREVSICKLRLNKDSVVYDIGSGTGSIAIEMASLSDGIQVFAIERNDEAVKLIQQNKEKFALENIKIVRADAPNGLEELPVPTHAFIGGTGKRMKEILDVLYKMNPSMRVVINAVTLETLSELKEVLGEYPIVNEEFVQMQVTRTRTVGSYHMMQAENPVWICAFDFNAEESL